MGRMIQHNLQEKYMHTSQVAHRQCLLTLSHSLACHIVQQCINAGQPDQFTRGPHSQHEVHRLNMNKPHSDATTTRQTTHGQRQTMCRSHSPPTSPTATLPRQEYRTPFNWTHTCYAMQLQMSSLRACLSPTVRPYLFSKA